MASADGADRNDRLAFLHQMKKCQAVAPSILNQRDARSCLIALHNLSDSTVRQEQLSVRSPFDGRSGITHVQTLRCEGQETSGSPERDPKTLKSFMQIRTDKSSVQMQTKCSTRRHRCEESVERAIKRAGLVETQTSSG